MLRNVRKTVGLMAFFILTLAACSQNASQENRAPVAVAGADRTVEVGATVTLDGTGSSDPDGDTLSYSWVFTGKPADSQAELTQTDQALTSFEADVQGTFELELQVSDGDLSASDSLSVTVGFTGERLEPGESLTGPDGVTVRAETGALSDAVGLSIQQNTAALDDLPLPRSLEPRGQAYELSASETTFAQGDAAFVVGLPVPEGVDGSKLTSALFMPADWFDGADKHSGHDVFPKDFWEILDGHYDAERNLWLTELYYLPTDGQVMVLAEGDYFYGRSPETAGLDALQSSREVEAICQTPDPSICDSPEQSDVEVATEALYTEFTGLAFREPRIRTKLFSDTYKIFIERFDTVGAGEDTDDVCEIDSGGAGISGSYNYFTKKITLCLDPDGFTNDRLATLRHEYFHATQRAYPAITDVNEKWFIEGTAAMAANSTGSALIRDSRNPRPVDISLFSDADTLEYRAQDFWLYLGRQLEDDITFMQRFFDEGAGPSQVDRVIEDAGIPFIPNLATAYWTWVKNQTFEKTVDIGGGVLGAPCVLDSDVATPYLMIYLPNNNPPPFNTSVTRSLGTVTSEVVKFVFEASSTPYRATARVVSAPDNFDPVNIKFYDPTGDCQATNPTSSMSVVVPVGQTRELYALVAHAGYLGADRSYRTEYEAEALSQIEVDFVQPNDGERFIEGGLIDFEVEVTDANGDFSVTWESDRDVTIIGPDGSATAGLFCSGDHTVTATVTDELGLSASDQVTFAVDNRPPTIELTDDPLPGSIGSGDYLVLYARAKDRLCTTPPGNFEADQQLIEWFIDGQKVGSGPALSERISESAGQEISVEARYLDEGGLEARTESLTLQVTTPPPGGYAPRPVIEAPAPESELEITLEHTLKGFANDAEDGLLADSALTWYVKDKSGDEVQVGIGREATFKPSDVGIQPGSGTIRLEATDSDGNIGETSITIDFQVVD